MYNLYDEIYDTDAYISGIIILNMSNNYRVLWKNGYVGVIQESDKTIEKTGRNFRDKIDELLDLLYEKEWYTK